MNKNSIKRTITFMVTLVLLFGSAFTVHAVTNDSNVVVWGDDTYQKTTIPAGLTSVKAIAAGSWHIVALKEDGTVVAWGSNNDGQTTVPAGLANVKAIAAGTYHTVALKEDGTVVAWGSNFRGQTTVPVGLTNVKAIAAGVSHTVALKEDGTVVAWGLNYNGQTTVPPGLTDIKAVAAGEAHTVALKEDGTVVAWGKNLSGQTTVPTGLANVKAIAVARDHTVALKEDGTVVAWGDNFGGQTTVPAGLANVKAIATGYVHTVALKEDGTVIAWGKRDYGQGTVPAGLTNVKAIAAGDMNTVALLPYWTGIAITTLPTKTEYLVGQSLDLSGLIVTGTYNDGTTATVPVTAANISGFDSSAPATGQTVTVTVDGKTAAFTVNTFVIAVTGVSLNVSSSAINVGANETLSATIAPANATNKNVTWTSSNPLVATVDSNGKILGVSAGTAVITITTVDGSKTATCTVTVIPAMGVTTDRLSGLDRIGTAIKVSNQFVSATTAILAPAADANLVDALAAAPLAGKTSPILLTDNTTLSPATKAQLIKLGVTKVYVVGAISQAVFNEVNEMPGVTAIQLKGADRIETAALISSQLTNIAGSFVVGYGALADALSVASYAAAHNYSIVVTNPDGSLPGTANVASSHVYLIGGPTLVKDIAGATRLAGADRYATNKKVLETLSYSFNKVYVANGTQEHLVDSLIASSLAAIDDATIILTDTETGGDATVAYIGAKLVNNAVVVALGGATVVSDTTLANVR